MRWTRFQRQAERSFRTLPPISLELQRVFGLRREESLKIKPHIADKGDKLEFYRHGAKVDVDALFLFAQMSNVYLKCKDTKSRVLYYQYTDYCGQMALKMLPFEKETRSFFGWVESFVPGTIAFNTRTQLGDQLQSAHRTFIKFSVNSYNNPPERKNDNESVKNTYEKKIEQDKTFKPAMKNQPNKETNFENGIREIKRIGMLFD